MDRKRTILEGTAYIVPTYPPGLYSGTPEIMPAESGKWNRDLLWNKGDGSNPVNLKRPLTDGERFFVGVFWASVFCSPVWILIGVAIWYFRSR